MRTEKYILCFGFFILISFPVINNLLNIVKPASNTENRALKVMPKTDTCSVDTYIKGLEGFLIDHTSIRNYAIRFHNKLNVFVFRSSPVNVEAFIGKDGWYYFSGEELKTFVGTELFTEKELGEFKNEMLRRKDIIEEKHNSHLFVAIVPNKANIYPEFMPDHIIRSETGGYGKQILNYLTKNGISTIDLYEPLTKAKQTHAVYYKTDNHWNDFGAFIASNVILKEFRKVEPKVQELDVNSYKVKRVEEKAGDIAKMLSVEDVLSDENYIPIPLLGEKSHQMDQNKYKCIKDFAYPWEYEHTRYTNNDSLPTILIIRDSFGAKPFKYISEQSKKCITIFDAWHYGLNEEIIASEKPDIILYLILESQLKNLMKYQKAEKGLIVTDSASQ